jgi:hypothetical protein
MKILKFIKKYFDSSKKESKSEELIFESEESIESEICIIGNIVDKHFYGEQKEIRRGTKHFRPNAKVYCLPEFGGMGHETIVVVGVPRKTKKFIKVAIPTKRIKDFKIKAVYKPKIVGYIKENHFYQNWRINKSDKVELQKFVDYLNTQTEVVV